MSEPPYQLFLANEPGRERDRGKATWKAQCRRIDTALQDLGLAYDPSGRESSANWNLLPATLAVSPSSWATLDAATRQRARALNALLTDIHNDARILRERILPPEVILANPGYQRCCYRLAQGQTPLSWLRVDFLQGEDHRWHYADTQANTPHGLSHAVQNRRILSQETPEVFADLDDPAGVVDFPLRLLHNLRRRLDRSQGEASILVLTPGPGHPAFFDHSFLARKMGLPLAQGGDLLVRENRVYFKSIRGMQPVRLIFRCLDEQLADPVVIPTKEIYAGIPGLVGAIRAGHVRVINALGTTVAQSRGLDAYWRQIVRFYLRERPVVLPVPTYFGGDRDQLSFLRESLEDLTLRPVNPGLPGWKPGTYQGRTRHLPPALQRWLRTRPEWIVGQALPDPQCPKLPGQPNPAGQRLVLSCFALCRGEDIDVLPGGLARFSGPKQFLQDDPFEIGDCCDVTVPAAIVTTKRSSRTVPAKIRSLALGSRAAENLFWLGRYAERADGTARMLHVFLDIGLEEFSKAERRRWIPLWEGLLEATGQDLRSWKGLTQAHHQDFQWAMVLDANNPGSLLSSLRKAELNFQMMRDFVSPEAGSFLNRLHDRLQVLSRRSRRQPVRRSEYAAEGVAATLDLMPAFFGTAERTLPHDEGWRFIQIGLYLERCLMTCSILRIVMANVEQAAQDDRREDADLTALVRMLHSQDVYRRTYQARSEPLFVADLFLCQPAAPNGAAFCLGKIVEHLEWLFRHDPQPGEPRALARECLHKLETLPLEHFLTQRTDSPRLVAPETATQLTTKSSRARNPEQSLEAFLVQLLENLELLSQKLQDTYLSHQASFQPAEHSQSATRRTRRPLSTKRYP